VSDRCRHGTEHEKDLSPARAFDQPLLRPFTGRSTQMAISVAWLANRVPSEVDWAFHNLLESGITTRRPGQDNAVRSTAATAIARRHAFRSLGSLLR